MHLPRLRGQYLAGQRRLGLANLGRLQTLPLLVRQVAPARRADDRPSPSNLTARGGEAGLSFRSSLSNPYSLPAGQRPAFRPGDDSLVVAAARLPPDGIVPDDDPPGHLLVIGVDPETLRNAIIDRGKLPP